MLPRAHTLTDRFHSTTHIDCFQLLDTSEELACIKLSLSLSLIARNQISNSKHSRLIAESRLAGKCTQPHLYQELLLSRSQGPNSRTRVTAVDCLMQLLYTISRSFKYTHYISRKFVSGFEPGTDGFSTFLPLQERSILPRPVQCVVTQHGCATV
jgi:hypothetical protein